MRTAGTLLMVAVAVLAQATIVNRLPFEWGPDLVLAAVVAVALTTNPAAAAGCGFAAGLAMDALPPAEHPMGRYALVLCVAAYLVSLLRANTGLGGAVGNAVSNWTALGITAVTAVGVGLTYALVGFLMGDANITLAAVSVRVGVGALLTTLFATVVTLPILWVRTSLAESDLATIQGPTSIRGW
ncbi:MULTISPECIES: rod shape-determining protein MreD [unclassified Nocardiopsis]|uniref:rod shape-determining protein MreD n=1 Tax=unclassified Nocardiopsis TaxID=2649073 RepID=UPI00066EDFF7|nr:MULTISPECIES: rod shape-determining protein MreD [unclassified Nocardiopsis]MBQ1080420.1 rod shape-determining protein MreD [Nocardiopsis sp. B62]